MTTVSAAVTTVAAAVTTVAAAVTTVAPAAAIHADHAAFDDAPVRRAYHAPAAVYADEVQMLLSTMSDVGAAAPPAAVQV